MTESTPNYPIVAPCGINCSLCLAYLRKKNRCNGCLAPENQKRRHLQVCQMRKCEKLRQTESKFCYACMDYPCTRLKQIEKRYRVKYNVLIYENFKVIKKSGLDEFMKQQKEKYLCPGCGGTICMHRGFCLDCEEKR